MCRVDTSSQEATYDESYIFVGMKTSLKSKKMQRVSF